MMNTNPETLNYRSLLSDALQEIRDLRARLTASETRKSEPIALVGMNCRFPGGANDPKAYWKLLREGREGIREIPGDRWNLEDYYDPDPASPGKMYARHGGFLDGIDRFDSRFFGITPLEAAEIDPQQRLLLEVSHGALESAGYRAERLKGSKTGVFIGICFDDYAKVSLERNNLQKINAFNSLGNSKSIAVGRLSYTFGFQGPALSLDTSCSSSLLAVHLACQSLRSGESDLALAGGVNLMLAPDVTIGFCKLRALSPTGRCRAFSAGADGYVRGEGCGIVVLKRLSEAIADGDNILAVIRGSASNHDGRSNGLTAPNGIAQEEVIREALQAARLQPADIQYVEAHGTGTILGDPIEVMALGRVLGEGRSPDDPVSIGSVKANLGHLEGAAGVAALIKAVLSLQNRQIPPQPNFDAPNPHIPWQKLPVRVPTELTPWTVREGVRRAGVSSFGMSGTNVHIVLEEVPASDVLASTGETPRLLTLSANTPTALARMATDLAGHLRQNPAIDLDSVAYTLHRGRSEYSYRRTLIGSNVEEVARGLETSAGCTFVAENRRSSVVFLFPGQGTQTVNMGQQLYRDEKIFRETIDLCATYAHSIIGYDIRSLLYPDTAAPSAGDRLRQTEVAQVVLFAFEYALAKLWMSWGVRPSAMIGHSLGEYVAACVAGVFSLPQALSIVAFRGRLMQKMPTGKMVAVVIEEKRLLEILAAIGSDSISIAAINSPSQIVVSGTEPAIALFLARCSQENILCRTLDTSHAFHSVMMEPVLEPFVDRLWEIPLQAPAIPYISNLTGTWIDPEQARDPLYWARHLRSTVRFADGLTELLTDPDRIFLEVGPGRVLSKLVGQQRSGRDFPCFSSFSETDPDSVLPTVGKLWSAGVAIDWQNFPEGQNRRIIPLPTYPFEGQRYWSNSSDRELSIEEKNVVVPTRPGALTTGYIEPGNEIEEFLTELLEENLGIRPLGIEDNFFELGGDSLLAIELISRVSRKFSVPLHPGQLLETPTIARLAEAIEKATAGIAINTSSVVRIHGGDSELPPLFLIHPAGGTVFCYQKFVPFLRGGRSVYGIEDPAIYQERSFASFYEKADYYLEQIRQIQPEGPYRLAGYSYGGNMALEIAIRLNRQGQEVEFLGMLDSFPPIAYRDIAIEDTRLLAAIWHMSALIFEKRSRDWLGELQKVDPSRQIAYVLEQLQADTSGSALPEGVLHERTLLVAMNNFRELHTFIPSEKYNGQIAYFWAEEKIPDSLSSLLNYRIPDDLIGDGWSEFSTREIDVHYVLGHHFTMLQEECFPVLCDKFLAFLHE
jgi:acyl transferase domain-containing protein/thioesterase domain-containing protein/acyl carrier protein